MYDVCSIMGACQKAIRQVNVHTSWELANKSDSPRRVKRQYMDSAKQTPQALEGWRGWGGAGPVFAPDYSSFRSPLEEVNAIIATQV